MLRTGLKGCGWIMAAYLAAAGVSCGGEGGGGGGPAAPRAAIVKDLVAAGEAKEGVRLSAGAEPGAAVPQGAGRAVKAHLAAGEEYPGVSVFLEKPLDASSFESVKFDLYLAAEKETPFFIRIDNAQSTDEEYRSRFNLGGKGVSELLFKPGENRLRISIERVVNGVINNPGLDVRSLTKLVLFTAKIDKDADLYIRRVWLEEVPPPEPADALLADFPAAKEAGFADWTSDPGVFEATADVDPRRGRRCVVRPFKPETHKWRLGGIGARTLRVRDWQAYDKLVLTCFNPLDRVVNAGLTIHDAAGKDIIYRCKAPPGAADIELPLSPAEIINLEEMQDASVWFEATDAEYELYLGKLSLRYTPGTRVVLADRPGESPAPGDWMVDLTTFYDSRGDRRLADIAVPRRDGEPPLIIKCRPSTTKAFRLILPAELAAKCRDDADYSAVGFYINRGEMLIYFKSGRPEKAGGATVIRPAAASGP